MIAPDRIRLIGWLVPLSPHQQLGMIGVMIRFTTEHDAFATIRATHAVTEPFSAQALRQAREASDRFAHTRTDRTDIPLVTIDPPGSMDLDQAMFIDATETGGWTLYYAIADVAAFITPGSQLEQETFQRGQTIYCPDTSIPLHPRELSENSASLLPDQQRAALLWEVTCDDTGETVAATVSRALVKSVRRFDYATVQHDLDNNALHPSIRHLPALGTALHNLARARGAIDLRTPDQEVTRNNGEYVLTTDTQTQIDNWNAYMSLLVGRTAAAMMIEHNYGILRTLPQPQQDTIEELRDHATALGFTWTPATSAAEFLDSVDANTPTGLAIMSAATSLFRGASYQPITSPQDTPEQHAGIAAHYAHVTAPLRRLIDRYGLEICVAHCQQHPVPTWVTDRLDQLPSIMSTTGRLASTVSRACIDHAECAVISASNQREFEAIAVKAGTTGRPGRIFIAQPTIIAPCSGQFPAGTNLTVHAHISDGENPSLTFTTN